MSPASPDSVGDALVQAFAVHGYHVTLDTPTSLTLRRPLASAPMDITQWRELASTIPAKEPPEKAAVFAQGVLRAAARGRPSLTRVVWSRRDGVAQGSAPICGRGGGVPVTRRRTVQTFDRDARGGRQARRMVADRLDAWGHTSERKPLELIVSELFTNAVRHGAGTVEIRLSVDYDVIRVEVCDEGGGRPVLRRPDPSGPELGGWGLQMVDQLTEAWGAIVDDSHTLVWAELLVRHLADRDAR